MSPPPPAVPDTKPPPRGRWAAFIAPPQFADAEDTRWAGMLHAIVLTVFAGYGMVMLVGVPFVFSNKLGASLTGSVILLAAVFAAATLRKARLMRLGGAVLCCVLFASPAVVMMLGTPNTPATFVAPVLIIVVLFGGAWGLAAALAGAAVSGFIIIAPALGAQLPRVFPTPPLGQFMVFLLQLSLAVVPVQIIMRRLGSALRRADIESARHERTQQFLAQSESRYRAVINTMAEGMILRDMDGEVIICNPAAERIIGLTAARMGRDSFPLHGWQTIHEDGSPFPVEDHPVMFTRRTGKPQSGVVMGFVRPQGPVKWLSINSVMLLDTDGSTPQGVLTTFFDITESKLAESALRQSEEKFAKTFQSNPAFIALSTLEEGRYIEVNGAFERVMGYRPDEVVGKTVADIGFWVNAGERDAMVEAIRRDHRVTGMQVQVRRANGEVIFCEASAELIELGGVQCIVSNTTDITERRRAQDALAQLNAELEQRVLERTRQLEAANQELESFSATVSHDLRAPARHISGYLDALRDNLGAALEGENRRYLQSATNAAARMSALIDALLEFSRLGRAELAKTEVDLNALVREAMQAMEPDTRNRDINWVVQDLPRVFADPSLLLQVMVNLLSNAVKYSRPVARARIEIGTLDAAPEAPGQTVVYVRDNGVGFDMRYADKLFGVFQRLHSEREFEGTGIGLANVGSVIQRHGGKVWIRGEPGKGASAYFSLPAGPPGASA